MKILMIAVSLMLAVHAYAYDNLITSGKKASPSKMATGRNCEHDSATFRCVQFLENYDGDTIKVMIPKVHPLLGSEIGIRVYGIDAPEMKSEAACEKQVAQIAKNELGKILRQAQNITLENVQRDKYFRILAIVKADGVDVSKTLVEKYLAYEYFGKTKQKVDWCKVKRSIASE